MDPDNSDAHENLPNNSYTQEVVEEYVVQGQNEETDHEEEAEGEHVHQDPGPPDGEQDQPLVRRSSRRRRMDWQCKQYNSIITREPG